jgi:hypothetical protein
MDNTMNTGRRRKGNLSLKNEQISEWKSRTETWKIYFAITNAFLDQKRVNVCEHAVMMASRESFWKVPPGGCETGGGGGRGKIKWKLSEVNARAVSIGQTELIGKFMVAAGDVISIRGRVMEYMYTPTGIKRELTTWKRKYWSTNITK